jgi:hypothetical protein
LGAPWGRVQALGEVLVLGRDPASDLVLPDREVRPLHARLRQVKGEWLLSAERDAPVWINGRAASILPLRSGDRVSLVGPEPDARAFVFEDGLAGAFVPPGTSRLDAWASVASARGRSARLAAYGVEATAPTREAFEREAEDAEAGGRVRVVVGAPEADLAGLRSGLEAATRQAGGPHPGLVHVLEVGVWSNAAGHRPWLVHAAPGEGGRPPAARAPLGLGAWLRTMAGLARSLAWLHRRGVVHGALGAATVVGEPDGGPRLLPSLASRTWRTGGAPRPLAVRTPGFVASEETCSGTVAPGPEVDVHDLCAFGVACWVGGWGEEHAARVRGLRDARQGSLAVRDLGLTLPPQLEQLLDAGLARVPAQRPNAADVARRLEGLSTLWGHAEAGFEAGDDPV